MAKRKTAKTNFFPLVLIISGSLLVAVSTTHSLLRLRALTLDNRVVDTYEIELPQAPTTPFPVHIYSQYFLDTDIEGQVYKDGHWTISDDHASYLLNSARPGQKGNIIIYGHNTRSILGNIRAYKGGEKITLTMSDGNSKDYIVKEMIQTSPDNTSWLEDLKHETLTIYTCAGFMDRDRFVVRAYPL